MPRKTSVIQEREWDLNCKFNNHLESIVESRKYMRLSKEHIQKKRDSVLEPWVIPTWKEWEEEENLVKRTEKKGH